LDSDNEEVEDSQIEPCIITSKEAIFALKKLRKIEINEGMKDLLKPLDYLENRIENNVLKKNKQLTLDQFFKNNM